MMLRMRSLWLALVLAGCGRLGFEETVGMPSHVADGASAGTAVLSLGDALIDTTVLTIDGVARDDFTAHPQLGGPEVAVLSVAALEVTGTVRVIGTRPLVVFATGAVAIDGVLDAGARGGEPGAGGYVDGPGHGASEGKPVADVCDPGGGGGGFGEAGADGGDENCVGVHGAGGGVYGDGALMVLEGGSGGGAGSPGACAAVPGGAGGGAVQVTSLRSIEVRGGINAGGGGGGGGPYCMDPEGDGGAGGGGGAGGAIFLEAPELSVSGVLRADGGGGGAGGNGNSDNGPIGSGAAGGDGTLAGPGAGGATGVPTSGSGGDGGTDARAAGIGTSAEFNPGGGGGGAGRIVVRTL
jgi:hypothetical protein